MRRFIRHVFLAAPLTFLGCAGGTPGNATADVVQLTRVGEAVRLTEDADGMRECEYITAYAIQGNADENALRALRNDAGRSGANFVLLVMENRTSISRAEGYLCAD